MAIDKIFNDSNVDGIADNIFGAVNNSVSEVKQMQQRKAAENVQMVVEAFKKIETNITEKFDNVTDVIEKRVLTIKDGRDGLNGSDGRNGRDGKPGRDGANGKQGIPGTPGKDGTDGVDGVSVTDASIDFDGSLVISLSSGQQINVGEVVPPELERQLVELRQGGSAGSSGDVAGPTSSTDNAIVRFDGTTGKLVQNSVVTIADTTGNMAGVGTLGAGAITATSLVSSGTTASSFTVTSGTAVPLTITNFGTGNSFLIEDSASPDASPFVIDASGGVIVGYTTQVGVQTFNGVNVSAKYFQAGTGYGGSGMTTSLWSATASATPTFNLARSKSAAIGTMGVVANGDSLGAISYAGDDGTNFLSAAGISAAVDGTPGTNDMPGRLVFSTTSDGGSTPTERVRIDSAGRLSQFGDTILSNVNVISASYDSVSFSIAGEETNPTDLFFSPDGLKMYVIGTTGDDVNEYNLSTAWVVSSAVYSTVFSVAGQDTAPQGLFFRADGAKMYLLGATNDAVFQYTLSTPWSVATASYDSISFSVAAEATPSGLWFKPNGLSMYMVGSTGDTVYQYTLSTAWNVSTATFLQSFSVSGQETIPNGVVFTGDGSRMFVIGNTGDDVNQYNLTTPWDISTSAFVNVFSISGQDAAPTGIYIKPDGTKMYMVGSTNDSVYQYTVPSIDIQLTGATSVAALDVQQDLNVYGNTQAYKISASNGVLVTSPAGLGYGTGSGGAVTQATSRTTGVTLSKPSGAITMFSAAGSVVAATFTVTNTLVAATDTIILNQKSGTNLYVLLVTAVAAGSFNVTFYTTGGIATDAPVINFSLIKGVTA
jgi:sugar lactone lactonase YvrE